MRTAKITLAAVALALAALGGAAACGSPASHSVTTAAAPAPVSSSAPMQTTDPGGASCPALDSLGYCPGDDPETPSAPDCTSQVQAWLSDTSVYPIPTGDLQAGIKSVYQDAQEYLAQFAGDPSGDAATTYLSILGDTNGDGPMTTLGDSIPTCADPSGDWSDAGTEFGNATSTDAGTSQAATDMQAVLTDLKALKAELGQTAPGSGLTL